LLCPPELILKKEGDLLRSEGVLIVTAKMLLVEIFMDCTHQI
jgi:hypothetical protein